MFNKKLKAKIEKLEKSLEVKNRRIKKSKENLNILDEHRLHHKYRRSMMEDALQEIYQKHGELIDEMELSPDAHHALDLLKRGLTLKTERL